MSMKKNIHQMQMRRVNGLFSSQVTTAKGSIMLDLNLDEMADE